MAVNALTVNSDQHQTGSTIDAITEQGVAVQLLVGGPPSAALPDGTRDGAPLVWNGTAWVELPEASALSAATVVSPATHPFVAGSDDSDASLVAGPAHTASVVGDHGELNGGSGQNAFRWGVSGADPTLCFFNGTPHVKITITGDTAGNTALQQLLAALDTYGLIVNSST